MAGPVLSAPPKTSSSEKVVQYDRYIEEQLRKTRNTVKGIDIAAGLMTLVATVLGTLLVLAVIDHWIIPLGFWLRLLALAGLAGATGYALVTQILPLVVRRINPAYAALAIERSTPSLKNSLLNFLLLRGNREKLSQKIYEELEEEAATRLSRVEVETTIDRRRGRGRAVPDHLAEESVR